MRKPQVGGSGSPPYGSKRDVELRVIHFVRDQLAAWRKSLPASIPPTTSAEDTLNEDLCGFLSDASHWKEWFFFQPEVRQKGRRRVDLSAKPASSFLVAQGYYSSIRDKIIVFEAKRLPAPEAARQREYVTGGAEISGGIQRFKRVFT